MSEHDDGENGRKVSVTVLLYLGVYLVIGLGAVTFASQPASSYHSTFSVSNEQPDGEEFTGPPVDVGLSVDVDGDVDTEGIRVEYRDADSGSSIADDTIASCGSSCSSSVTWSSRSAGNYAWEVRVCDTDHHSSCSGWFGTYTFEVNGVPSISNANPTGRITGTSPTLSVDIDDPDGDSVTVTFTDSGGSQIGSDTVSGSGTASTTWSGLSEGQSYDWSVTADDGTESSSSGPHSLEVNAPPSISNLRPDDTTVRTQSPTLRADISDANGDSVTVDFVNDATGNVLGSDTVSGSGTASYTWSGRNPGSTYSWHVETTDGYESADSGTATFDVNSRPQLSSLYPGNDESVSTTSPTLSVDVTDPEGDSVDVTFINADTGDTIGSDTVSGSGTASYEWSGLTRGDAYSFEVEATDGHLTENAGPNSFEVNGRPEVVTHFPEDEAVRPDLRGGRQITLNATVRDLDGEELTVRFYDASDDSLIHEATVQDTDTPQLVETTWTDPSEGGGPYSWYVNASDDQETDTGGPWSFTIAEEPNVTCSDCFTPEIVGVGEDIRFNPDITDESSGAFYVCLTQGCGLGSQICSSNYVTSGTCTATVQQNWDFRQDFWVMAEDDHGNSDTIYGGQFTVNKRLVVNTTDISVALGSTISNTVSINNIESSSQTYRLEAVQTSDTDDGRVVTSIRGGGEAARDGGVLVDVPAEDERSLLIGFEGAQCFSTCTETVEIRLTNTQTGDRFTEQIDVTIEPESEEGVAAPALQIPQLIAVLFAALAVIGLRGRWSA